MVAGRNQAGVSKKNQDCLDHIRAAAKSFFHLLAIRKKVFAAGVNGLEFGSSKFLH
jgi:hypothetical protein